ncbi:MAG: alpha/beta-type small acid-soluble spore protein [Firmicutes bacterium]|nr:alpha/beta-type small acid-soluble spore protein [Bacillota bacterium]
MANNNLKVYPKAEAALDKFKYEVADELGLTGKIQEKGWENMTTREVGKIGGHMVKKLIAKAEETLAEEDKS